MAEIPIACTLSPDALRARRENLLADVLQRAEHYQLNDAGLRMRFSAGTDTVATLARMVEAERHCCRFLRFVITIEPDGGPLWLELSGPAGTRDFIAALLDL